MRELWKSQTNLKPKHTPAPRRGKGMSSSSSRASASSSSTATSDGSGSGGAAAGRRRHRHRSRGAGGAAAAGQKQEKWSGPEQRAMLMRKVAQCIRDHDRREVMALLRDTAVQRRESGLVPLHPRAPAAQARPQPSLTPIEKAADVIRDPMKNSSSSEESSSSAVVEDGGTEELTLLQGACLDGGSVDLVASLLINGASPDVATRPIPLGKGMGGRGIRWSGGYTPLHLALIGCGRERKKIVKELLIYGADVNVKDAEGYSFLDLVTNNPAYTGLHPLIAQAAKDPRAKKAQEASRALQEVRRLAVQRQSERREDAELVDPMESLPFELSLHILSYLSLVQLAQACQVSTLWRWVGTDHDLWRRLYVEQLGPVPDDAEHNFQALLQRELTLKAEREAKARKQEMQIAKLVVQIVTHPRCYHSNHQQQIAISSIPSWAVYRRYYLRGSSVVLSLDAHSQQIRLSSGGYLTINDYLEPEVARVTHSSAECKVRCKNLSGRRTTYNLKVGDKLCVLQHQPQNGTCRVLFFSHTLDPDNDHCVPPTTFHYYNR